MKTVKVDKSELLEKVVENRKFHLAKFLEAQEGYRKIAIELLDESLKEAREGGNIVVQFNLVSPQDHTDDYDRVIAMLKMSVDDEIELSDNEFSQFVMDEWGWSQSFDHTHTLYSATLD